MMDMRRRALLAFLILIAACGDDSTGTLAGEGGTTVTSGETFVEDSTTSTFDRYSLDMQRATMGDAGGVRWELWSADHEARRCMALVTPDAVDLGPTEWRDALVGCIPMPGVEPIAEATALMDEQSRVYLFAGLVQEGAVVMGDAFLAPPTVLDGMFVYAVTESALADGIVYRVEVDTREWVCTQGLRPGSLTCDLDARRGPPPSS